MLAAPAAMIPLALHFGLTYASTGFLMPLYGRVELYRFEGAYWCVPTGIDALFESKGIYLFHMLLGHHGVFGMMPVLLFAVAGMVAALRRGSSLRTEAGLVLLPALAVTVMICMRTRNYGGTCVGMRWLLFFVPLLFAFLGPVLAWLSGRRALITVYVLFVLVGAVQMVDSTLGTSRAWRYGGWHRLLASKGWGSVSYECITGAPAIEPEQLGAASAPVPQ